MEIAPGIYYRWSRMLAHGVPRARSPAVLGEQAHEYFEMPPGMDAPFMLLVPKVREEKRAGLPAVTHQDGTGRVQTATEAENGRFYRLIRVFGRLTGVPIVLNTSFNVRGEPIVCSPADAYPTFVNTGIDAMVIGNYVVTQKPDRVDYEAGMRRSVQLEACRAEFESIRGTRFVALSKCPWRLLAPNPLGFNPLR